MGARIGGHYSASGDTFAELLMRPGVGFGLDTQGFAQPSNESREQTNGAMAVVQREDLFSRQGSAAINDAHANSY
jgi:hypothetical protein